MYYNPFGMWYHGGHHGGPSMAISIRMHDKELELIKKYAELNGMTVSEVMRKAILEKIEDEFDIFLYEKAINEPKQDNKTYSLDEVKAILGIK